MKIMKIEIKKLIIMEIKKRTMKKKNKNTRKVLLKDPKKFFYHDINKLKYLKNLDIDQKIYENLIPQWKQLTNEKQWVIGTLNCHGLTKVGEIDALAQDLCEMKSDIFVITETWEKENNIEFRYKHLLNNYNLWSTITFL